MDKHVPSRSHMNCRKTKGKVIKINTNNINPMFKMINVWTMMYFVTERVKNKI
jgi:hypothetical protein